MNVSHVSPPPTIAVVIPTYNRAGLVHQAIDSVLAQTHPATEIIVVDDGSKDDTRAALAAYGGRIKAVHQANTGLSGARNTGIKAATSEWIAFLDDDDEYAPDRLTRAVESIRRFPATDAHLTNTAIVSESGPALDLFQVRGMKCTEWMELARPLTWVLRGCFFAQSLVARRSALHAIGLFRPTFYEDMDLFVRLTARSPWIVDSSPALRLIRRGSTSAMSDDWRARPVARCEALVRIHREALLLPGLVPAETRLTRTGLGTYLFELGAAFADRGERSAARRSLSEAARVYPALRSQLKAHAAALGGRPVLRLIQYLTAERKAVIR